ATPAPCIFSTSALPPSGVDCASPSTGSIFAPPIDLMPPAALISSIASWAPMRPCWPEYDSAPETGCSTPTFTAAPCARSTAGEYSAAAPIAVDCRKRRRLTDNGRDMGSSPAVLRASLTLVARGFYIILLTMTQPQTVIDKIWAAHEILRR